MLEENKLKKQTNKWTKIQQRDNNNKWKYIFFENFSWHSKYILFCFFSRFMFIYFVQYFFWMMHLLNALREVTSYSLVFDDLRKFIYIWALINDTGQSLTYELIRLQIKTCNIKKLAKKRFCLAYSRSANFS